MNNNNALVPTQQLLPTSARSKALALLERYPTPQQCLGDYPPARIDEFARYPDRCIMGNSPTLRTLENAYGEAIPIQWLMTHLVAISEYSGGGKITPYQLEKLARKIMNKFPWLKMSEYSLFFSLAEGGDLGQFSWKNFDPISFLKLFDRFLEIRGDVIDREESKATQRRLEQERLDHQRYLQQMGDKARTWNPENLNITKPIKK